MLLQVLTAPNINFGLLADRSNWGEEQDQVTAPDVQVYRESSLARRLPGCLQMRRALLFPWAPTLALPWLYRGGDTQVPSSASPCSLLSHLISRKGNPGDWAGQELNRTLTSASRGPDLATDTTGHTPLIFPNEKKMLEAHWQYCAVMCLTLFLLGMFLPPSPIPPRLSDVSFSAVSNTDNKLLEAGICRE